MENQSPQVQEVAIKLVENKLSLLRKYITEVIIVVLSACVLYLFKEQGKREKDIIEYYKNDNAVNNTNIQRSTSVIETNNTILLDLRQLLRETTYNNSKDTSK